MVTAPTSTVRVCELIGASYRQVHYWVSRGWIPGMRFQGPGHKVGWNQAGWTPEQVNAAALVKFRLDLGRALLADPTVPLAEHVRRLGGEP